MRPKRSLTWWSLPLSVGAFLALAWLERRRPLRRSVEPKLQREVRNLAIAGVGAAVVQLVETPVVESMLSISKRKRWGVVRYLPLPRIAASFLSLLLMDYSMYLWHELMHRISLLWRFHLAHHSDLDMDASTALRFHFGELLLSVPWRAGQIGLIGISAWDYRLWQSLFLASIIFHHSSFRLPLRVERLLGKVLVTPRMHAIHHSVVLEHSHSNYSSGLSLWDRFHGTLRLSVQQSGLELGVPLLREPNDVTLAKTLLVPFASRPQLGDQPSDAAQQRSL